MLTLPLWFDNPACTGKAHCPTCRKKESGRLWRERLRNAFTIPETDFECPHGEAWRAEDAPPTPAPLPGVPFSQWPRRVKLLAKLKRDGETGVGDTLKRLIGDVHADKLAKLYTLLTGNDCGCADRQAQLNHLYPYGPLP